MRDEKNALVQVRPRWEGEAMMRGKPREATGAAARGLKGMKEGDKRRDRREGRISLRRMMGE